MRAGKKRKKYEFSVDETCQWRPETREYLWQMCQKSEKVEIREEKKKYEFSGDER